MKWFTHRFGEFFAWESYRHREPGDKTTIALDLPTVPFATGMAIAPRALAWFFLEDSTLEQAVSHLERCWASEPEEAGWAAYAKTALTYFGQFWS
ncbi:hypothetical protein P7L53_03445 [Thermoleptolyngbya sichuanensis XZ-Cy5]|uniref:hypothetical protein n=1 Tax=Thermoleptolyngbya sichuanensis TaxID=2885951 RepID=UPI00240D5A18|nr:hypothetical protein [Thermoleptolyngbya sichuanensis]MDG2615289.1 hypothetical protein [Thermoleptolyngbya sichuanensis XZ-Cy5]